MAIDISNQELIRKLTLQDLIDDAIERKDKEALRWLEDEAFKQVTRKKKDSDETVEVTNPIISIRAAYLRKFLGYEPQPNKPYNKEAAKAKRIADRKAMFAAAFAKISE